MGYNSDVDDDIILPLIYCFQVYEALHGGQTSRDGLTMMPILLHSRSRGNVRLASTDPFDQPLIDPNYLADQRDIDVLLEGKYSVWTDFIWSVQPC